MRWKRSRRPEPAPESPAADAPPEVPVAPVRNAARRAKDAADDDLWEQAADLYLDAVRQEPTNADLMLRLASAYDRTRRADEAKAVALYAALTFLDAGYDAVGAVKNHARLFAERHEVATFCADNAERIREAIASEPEPAETTRLNVFVYWNSDTMPRVVARCRESLREFSGPDVDLHELTDETIGDYVDLDPTITAAFSENKAFFSDYLRTQLLSRYGGLWLDSTVLATDDIGATVKRWGTGDAFFFAYSGSRVASWYMWSRQGGYIATALRTALDLWWSSPSGRQTNYFMFHDFVEMLFWVDPEYRELYRATPRVHPRPALQMLDKLAAPYDRANFERIVAGSPVHKLTYKYQPSAEHGGTYLERLLTA